VTFVQYERMIVWKDKMKRQNANWVLAPKVPPVGHFLLYWGACFCSRKIKRSPPKNNRNAFRCLCVKEYTVHTMNEKGGESFHAPSHVRLWECVVDEFNYEKSTCKGCEVKQEGKLYHAVAEKELERTSTDRVHHECDRFQTHQWR
jgi:hypothetical protein